MSSRKPSDQGDAVEGPLRGLGRERAGVSSGDWKAAADLRDSPPPTAASSPSSGRMKSAEAHPASWERIAVRRPASGSDRVQLVMGEPPPEPAMVSIRARCHDDLLEYTHRFVGSYARGRFRNAVADALGVATYELLGNALNYGSALSDVVFEIVHGPNTVAVRVSNETVQVRINMLTAHLERIQKDPEAAFLEEMRRSTAGGLTRPMLGLARVVHESKLSLHAYLRGTRLTVAASTPM